MDVGKRLKSEREKQGISREEVAKTIGKSVEFVAKFEGLKRRLSIEDLVSIAALLGRPVEFFTGDQEQEEPRVERDLLSYMESADLDPSHRAQLHAVPRLRSKQAIVELVKGQKARGSGIFRQESYELEIEVLPHGDCTAWWRSRIQVLDRQMSFLPCSEFHLLGLGSRTGPAEIGLLRNRSICAYAKMEERAVHDAFGRRIVGIAFDPPLQRGDTADICCDESHTRVFQHNCRDLDQVFPKNEGSTVMARERIGIPIFTPSDAFRSRITFPVDYGIDNIECSAFVSGLRFMDECERLAKEKCLSVMIVGSRYVVELQVHRPVVGTQYFLFWRPTMKRPPFRERFIPQV